MLKKVVPLVLVLASVLGFTAAGFAFTTPAEGSLYYELYDALVNDIIMGPIGTAAGIGLIAYGGISLALGRWLGALLPVLGGIALVKAESIATSVGMTIGLF